MKKLIFLLTFLLYSQIILSWPTGADVNGFIIFNSTTAANQTIALGIRPSAEMAATNGNVATSQSANYKNATGIAYKFPDGNWMDATTPGCLCEGWGAGAVDQFGREFHGEADKYHGSPSNVLVKSFVHDETSISSRTWINDPSGNAVMEVIHQFGPSTLRPNELFEAIVTITNISGNTLTDVRYNRTMDWDIPPTEFSEIVTIVGAANSHAATTKPRIHRSGNNGFRNPNVFGGSYLRAGMSPESQDFDRYGPKDHGFTATFAFDDLLCGEAHTFKIYYGAAATKPLMIEALVEEGVSIYSLGEPNSSTSLITYAFGFKGVSGTALAPTLPEKIAILPGGVETDETKIQTYATPVLANAHAYQATFKFRKDHQWEGDILRYALDEEGNFKDTTAFPPLSAADILEGRNFSSADHINSRLADFTSGSLSTTKARNIWTVGYDADCPQASMLTRPLGDIVKSDSTTQSVLLQNNFVHASDSSAGNTDTLEALIYNCGTEVSSGDLKNLIRFVRGYDSYDEDPGLIRQSLIGDTFHSDLIFVGTPGGSTNSENTKTEAYFRAENNYAAFKETHKYRPERLYVAANDGMLHAYDKDLNDLWGFIPPSVLPKLRNLVSKPNTTNTEWLVDGPIIVKDIYINATSEWKTVLVGSLGWGGKGYYVLDISDAWNPKHLFTINNDTRNKQVNYWSESGYKTTYDYAAAPASMDYSGLGDTWARPSIILLPYTDGTNSQRYVMTFGAGYAGGTSTGVGNFVYVLDFEPSATTFSDPVTGTSMTTTSGGNVIKKIAIAPDAASDIPNGVTANMSVVTADTAWTADFWGGIAYFPDLTGQVWKLDLSKTGLGELNNSMWTLTRAFKAEGTLANDRYGYNQMATTLVESTTPIGTHLFNYFGTGDQAHVQRRDATIKNRIYGVKDIDFPGTDLATTGSSKNITSDGVLNINGAVLCSSADVPAWYADAADKSTLDDADSGGDFIKVVGRALVTGGDVFFTLYRPENLDCPIGGSGQVIKMVQGCTSPEVVMATGAGLSTAPVMDSEGNIYVGVSNLATEGELDVVASATSDRSGVNNILKIGTSDLGPSDAANEARGITIKSWRELRR